MHLLDLAGKVKEGVQAAGLVGLRFNTIGVSDGISMGTEGMSYSLQSREIIADSIETVGGYGILALELKKLLKLHPACQVMSAQWYDANISIPGCDKNMPGVMIAMARVNRPSLIVYGGTTAPGKGCGGQSLDIVSAFQSYGEYIAGRITEEERQDIVHHSCPGQGSCGGMYTANTSEHLEICSLQRRSSLSVRTFQCHLVSKQWVSPFPTPPPHQPRLQKSSKNVSKPAKPSNIC